MYWSIRRELWEHRSLTIAPVVVAAVIMFGWVISTVGMPSRRRALMDTSVVARRAAIAMSYDFCGTMLILTVIIIGAFYCLDSLHGERRDRSILFWKSLPVSDRTAVIAKFTIPLLVLPSLIFAIIVAEWFAMLVWSTIVLLPSGLATSTWANFNIFEHTAILFYGLIALVLWHAPIYGWLLLISAWAKRSTFLWAVLPPVALSALEKITFGTTHVGLLLQYRFLGYMQRAFALDPRGHLYSISQITPGTFLATPGLWLGLIFTAIFVAAAVRLRRNREPI
jgi:ABC-2 type transport system permease protein